MFDNYQLTQHHGLTSRVLAASVLLYTDYSIMLNDPEIQSNWKLSVYERTHQHRNAYRESLEQTSKYYLQLTGQDPALFDRIFSRIK